MALSPFTSFLTNAIQKSSRMLLRDYFELEMLQSSKNLNAKQFVNRSITRTSELITTELRTYPQSIVIKDPSGFTENKVNFLLTAVDNSDNMEHALPFFATIIVALKQIDNGVQAIATIIDFPACGELYYAERGAGSWLSKASNNLGEKNLRLRVSTRKENIMVVGQNILNDRVRGVERNFGSNSYASCLVASGKLDAMLATTMSQIELAAAKLLIIEAGGQVLAQNSEIILTNSAGDLIL